MTVTVFLASELLDMALQVERQGLDFYETCQRHAIHATVKEALQLLAREEQRHMKVFTEMKSTLRDYELPESYPGEAMAYVDVFVKDRVFPDAVKPVESEAVEDVDKTIDMAIGFEQRSILFYSMMKQMVRESERSIVEQVIAEEHSHVRGLLALRDKLQDRRRDGTSGKE